MAKNKCIYCGTKMKEESICPLCKRENKELAAIETIDYSPFTDEQLEAARNTKPGVFYRKIRDEILAAAEENRLLIGKVLTDGIYAVRDGEGGFDYYQFVCKEDGTPVRGRFYISYGNAISEDDGKIAYIISFENRKGKRYYEIISQADYEKISAVLLVKEATLYQGGMYEDKRTK